MNTLKKGKIFQIHDLARLLARLRTQGKIVVLCHGVFDLLHIGHFRYFEQAKQKGDILVVTLTPDRFVDKGPNRPTFTEKLRAEAIASLSCTDYVAVNDWPTAEETLSLLRPNFYAKGSEFKNIYSDRTGKMGKEAKVAKEIGCELVFIEDIVFSSSNLINRYFSNFPKELQEYLNLFRNRYTFEQVLNQLDDMAKLNVLVLGDTIIDDYHYCDPLGKSSKDPVLAVKYQSNDLFPGGTLAVANHIAQFAKCVTLGTVIGEIDSHEVFIRGLLDNKVEPHFFYQKNAPTIIKRRFIHGYSLNKLLEIYVMDDRGLDPEEDNRFRKFINTTVPNVDLVIVADYGHGAISNDTTQLLCRKAPFLAVNTQANAGNRGFHTITKYNNADYICLSEHEMRLEARDSNGALRPKIEKIANKLRCKKFVVTNGRKGCTVWSEQNEYIKVPAFASKVLDRIGAGDAFLSITAMAAYLNTPNEMLGFIGNAVGALAVEIVGNQKPIKKSGLDKYITSILK